MAEVASIRNTIIGHTVAVAVAFVWLEVFGLVGDPSAIGAHSRDDHGVPWQSTTGGPLPWRDQATRRPRQLNSSAIRGSTGYRSRPARELPWPC